MKVAILGYSGAGKSTLAKELGHQLSLPVLHLDTINCLPGWQERPREEARAMAAEFMKKPGWVIDGNYASLLQERRLDEADSIILLAFPRFFCLYWAWRRYRQNRGTVRDTVSPGCPEKFDLAFIWWILWEGRNKKTQDQYRRIQARYPEKLILCRNRCQAAEAAAHIYKDFTSGTGLAEQTLLK